MIMMIERIDGLKQTDYDDERYNTKLPMNEQPYNQA